MRFSRLFNILGINLAGIILFFSWYIPANHGFWMPIDSTIFYSFNHQMVLHHWFAVLVAITNYRGFDGVSLLAMGIFYYSFWRKQVPYSRRKLIAIGITMLITAVILNQLGHLLPVKHSSPSLFFTDAYRVGELTGISTKDSSNSSFPGDHGMMLIIYACFMWRYFGLRALGVGSLILIIFALPRLMAGAHWFTDIAVGSLSVVLVGLSWWLLTPASDILVNWIEARLPGNIKQ